MGAPVSALDLSDEDFLKQGTALLEAGTTTVDNHDHEGQDEEGDEAARAAQAAADDAAAKAAQEAEAAAAAAANRGGTGDDINQDEVDPDIQVDPAKDPASAGKKRGPDGKFVADEPAKQGEEGKTNAADGAAPANKDTKAGEQDPAGKDGEQKPVNDQVNYQAQVEELFKPFKANGRDIKVDSIEEARRLMQMGANYNKKMTGLKPHLTMLKMLENNGLLSEEKIGFLIDLDKKNPEAISKLIKDSGINPLDISVDKAGDYKPGDHRVDESEVELDNVLDDLKVSKHYSQLLNIVGTEWDAKSRALVASNPNVLRGLNAQMENGIYDLVATEMVRQRALGSLSGLSDLEAYRQVGDAMNSDGKFDHILKPAGQPGQGGQQAPAAKVIVNPNPKKADDDKREQQRRAAAPARGAAPAAKAKTDFNPLALSDEEFAKFKPTF